MDRVLPLPPLPLPWLLPFFGGVGEEQVEEVGPNYILGHLGGLMS